MDKQIALFFAMWGSSFGILLIGGAMASMPMASMPMASIPIMLFGILLCIAAVFVSAWYPSSTP